MPFVSPLPRIRLSGEAEVHVSRCPLHTSPRRTLNAGVQVAALTRPRVSRRMPDCSARRLSLFRSNPRPGEPNAGSSIKRTVPLQRGRRFRRPVFVPLAGLECCESSSLFLGPWLAVRREAAPAFRRAAPERCRYRRVLFHVEQTTRASSHERHPLHGLPVPQGRLFDDRGRCAPRPSPPRAAYSDPKA